LEDFIQKNESNVSHKVGYALNSNCLKISEFINGVTKNHEIDFPYSNTFLTNERVSIKIKEDSVNTILLKNIIIFKTNEKFGVYLTQKSIILPIYDYLQLVTIRNKNTSTFKYCFMVGVKNQSSSQIKYGLLNIDGSFLLPIEYDDFLILFDRFDKSVRLKNTNAFIDYDQFFVKKNNKFGVVKLDKTPVFSNLYEHIKEIDNQSYLIVNENKYGLIYINSGNLKILEPIFYKVPKINKELYNDNYKDFLIELYEPNELEDGSVYGKFFCYGTNQGTIFYRDK
jgi:hypothetical protein